MQAAAQTYLDPDRAVVGGFDLIVCNMLPERMQPVTFLDWISGESSGRSDNTFPSAVESAMSMPA